MAPQTHRTPQARCLVLQHIEPESPYAIAHALYDAGVVIDTREVFDGAEVPDALDGYHGLVVMGGPMSATSDDGFPSRAAELAVVKEALALGVPTLGVCLGAQLLALAGGGRVYPGSAGKEIGWGVVDLAASAADDQLFDGLPSRLEVLHWHGDTFDLPPAAVHLASSPAYANQAFRCGPSAWALQFHLEVTGNAVEAFAATFAQEATEAGVPPELISAAAPGILAQLAPARDLLLRRFAALVNQYGAVAGS